MSSEIKIPKPISIRYRIIVLILFGAFSTFFSLKIFSISWLALLYMIIILWEIVFASILFAIQEAKRSREYYKIVLEVVEGRFAKGKKRQKSVRKKY